MRKKKLDISDKIINSLWKDVTYVVSGDYKGPSSKNITSLFSSKIYREVLTWVSEQCAKQYYIYCDVKVNNFYCATIYSKDVRIPK